jgi:hypothetical protein
MDMSWCCKELDSLWQFFFPLNTKTMSFCVPCVSSKPFLWITISMLVCVLGFFCVNTCNCVRSFQGSLMRKSCESFLFLVFKVSLVEQLHMKLMSDIVSQKLSSLGALNWACYNNSSMIIWQTIVGDAWTTIKIHPQILTTLMETCVKDNYLKFGKIVNCKFEHWLVLSN